MKNINETSPSIVIRNLGKSYNLYNSNLDRIINSLVPFNYPLKNHTTFWVIRDLNLQINKGDRIAIIGENGAGKSTLLKILSGTVPPTEGEVDIYGKIEALLQAGVGFHPDLTGRENIHAFFAYKNISRETLKFCERDIADFTELGDFLDQPISSYSLGMLARLSFAVATCIMPEILIVDEVLGAGDAYFFGKSLERMRNFTQDKNSTVLFVSHDLNVLQKLCNRAIWIHHGEIISDGLPSDVIKMYLDYIDFRTENRHKAHEYWNKSKVLQKLIPSEEVYRSHIFNMQPETVGKVSSPHIKINKICLYNNDNLISTIYPGKARDNDNSTRGYLVEGRDVGWGEAIVKESLNYREINLKLAKYSPFVFKDNICAWGEKSNLKLKVFHSPIPKDATVAVKYWVSKNNAYETIGYLNVDSKDLENSREGQHNANVVISEIEYRLDAIDEENYASVIENKEITSENELDTQIHTSDNQALNDKNKKDIIKEEGIAEKEENIAEQFEYSQDSPIRINQVSFINPQGENKRVLIAGEPLKIFIDYKVHSSVSDPVFAITFHSTDGTQMDHKNTELAGLKLGQITKDNKIVFSFNPLRLGPGEYVVSVAILKHLDIENWITVPPAYDRHNRAYRLTILPDPKLRVALGSVVQECQIILNQD
ncbi:MAG: hypothetical protein BGO77_07840 [Caedibacter sp. 37-49]|nr:MAG: hypothetical protein BGO77_07840 [Caedibacter sp. 37-49]